MEENGGFQNRPDLLRAAKVKMEEAKNKPHSTTDYQKRDTHLTEQT
jgi:hypothetical protein